jgi:tRNA C32,U32 (ribose-2'-O)-methylase TrmJ
VMRRNLRNMFHRMQLSEQDVRTLRGMVVRLVKGQRDRSAYRPSELSTDETKTTVQTVGDDEG